MSLVCPTCGLVKELCVCESIAKESQKIRITAERKKFGKIYTVIEGMDKDIDVKELAKKLKSKYACGGTVKSGRIELQGDHKGSMKSTLVKLGFAPDSIEIG